MPALLLKPQAAGPSSRAPGRKVLILRKIVQRNGGLVEMPRPGYVQTSSFPQDLFPSFPASGLGFWLTAC